MSATASLSGGFLSAVLEPDSGPAARALPADCKRGSPPPGVSATLVAVCLLGCFLALLLTADGVAAVGEILR